VKSWLTAGRLHVAPTDSNIPSGHDLGRGTPPSCLLLCVPGPSLVRTGCFHGRCGFNRVKELATQVALAGCLADLSRVGLGVGVLVGDSRASYC
jgi:hypothetical protein